MPVGRAASTKTRPTAARERNARFLGSAVRTASVDDDIPADVQDTLVQLFEECGTALEAGDLRMAREAAASARSVATNKLPEGDLRAHLLHGCDRVEALLDPEEEEVEADAAGEYVAAMRRRLPGEG